MKKITAVLLAILFMFTLAACGESDYDKDTTFGGANQEEAYNNEKETRKNSSGSDSYDTVNITADIGALTVVSGEKFSFEVRNINQNWLETEKTDDTFTVKYSPSVAGETFSGGGTTHELLLTLPEEGFPKELNITIGAGVLTVTDAVCGDLSIHQGAGAVNINGISAYDGKLYCGAGKFSADNVSFTNSLDVTGGMGYAVIKGSLGDTVNISGGIGAMRFDSMGSRDEYTVTANSPLRPLFVNGSAYGNDGSWQTVEGDGASTTEAGSEKTITVSGGIGRIDINFAQ